MPGPRHRHVAALVCAAVCALGATARARAQDARAGGATRFAAAPHFLVLDDRERIVLFADGSVAGAVAERRADGGFDVTVPGVAVDPQLAGRSFDDRAAGGSGATRVVLTQDPSGDARVRIEGEAGVERVHAFAASKPSRLTIDLLRGGARPASSAAAKAPGATQKRAPGVAQKSAPGATQEGASRPAATTELASPRPTPASTRSEPSAEGAAKSTTRASAREVAATATAAPAQGAHAGAESGATRPVSAVPAPEPAPHAAKDALACRWRRVEGVPYCAPDPAAPAYAVDLAAATLAGRLDRARSGPVLQPLRGEGAIEDFLNADVALVRAAPGGWLLPVVQRYAHALRSHPDFADAERARANLVLAHYTIGFAPELERLARAGDAAAPLAAALLAELRRQDGDASRAEALVADATRAGGFTACVAERVRAAVAADRALATQGANGAPAPAPHDGGAASPSDSAAAALARLAAVCPRTIVEDPATAWLRGRVLLAQGQARRAAETLAPLEAQLPPRERALVLADLARAYDAAGDATGARRVAERLASGAFGARARRHAQLALAARDAADGEHGAAGLRLAALPIEDARHGRAQADLAAATELLHAGDASAALGLLTERGIDPRRLAPEDQVALARALRRVGLRTEAEGLLRGLRAIAPARLPDAFFAETGAQALARGDADAALAAADEWVAARSGAAPPGALALRARAHAARGDARDAGEVAAQLLPLDARLGREVAVEVARGVRSADPALALRLARGALDAPAEEAMPPAQAALALRTVAEAAETTGDAQAARDAFARLAAEHGDEPEASGAAYRAARLAATPSPGATVGSQGEDDALSRRVAAAGRLYAEVVDLARAGEER